MKSIKSALVRNISIAVSALLIAILLITDISVDSWISAEFDRAMTYKASLLISLVSEESGKVEFDFADDVMPEFSGATNPEYFQLWRAGVEFERSRTLSFFTTKYLSKQTMAKNSLQIVDITLPDGRSGRMISINFTPQVHSHERIQFNLKQATLFTQQQSMQLAYALSTDKLNRVLWFVDLIFFITSLSVIVLVRITVGKVVNRGLSPLIRLNHQLQEISFTSDKNKLKINQIPLELLPIVKSINQFIVENSDLYEREKRITSDIAHELKTPITELLNLSEVAIKFPEDREIADSFKPDVLDITLRMKDIVNGILLLQKSTSLDLEKTDVDCCHLLATIMQRLDPAQSRVNIQAHSPIIMIYSNAFALETILNNLFTNALFHSPWQSQIEVNIYRHVRDNKTCIDISNRINGRLTDDDLSHFFEPLWQKDRARASTQHFGLGLTIVKSFCDKINARIDVSLDEPELIKFSLLL